MKLLFMTSLLLISVPTAFAAKFSSRIHSIEMGNNNESHLVRFDNSRVTFVHPKDRALIRSLMASKQRQENVGIETDKDNQVVAAQSTAYSFDEEDIDDGMKSIMEPYEPTVVKGYNAALNVFRGMRRDYSLSGECYNRAHIWAYEDHKKSKRNLMKIFMFFTTRYIRLYKFHWWFHVTPMAFVNNMSSPRTLDRRYTAGPLMTKTWSDVFVRSKRKCPIVTKFDDFFLNQKTQHCFHIYTSMYFVTPRDIEKRDLTGVVKEEFIEKEVNRAYKNAFKRKPCFRAYFIMTGFPFRRGLRLAANITSFWSKGIAS